MKKIILVLLCSGSVIAANAQLNSVLLFGNFGGQMNTQNDPGTKEVRNSFDIMPGVGYQVGFNWTVGVEGSFNYMSDNTTSSGVTAKSSTMGYGGGVFGRYTVPISPLLYFYTQADGVYSTSNSYDNSGKSIPGSMSNNFNLKLTPVLGINIRNGYGLNFSIGGIGYNYNNVPSSKETTSNISYNFAQTFTFGVSKSFIHHMRVVEHPIEDMGSSKPTQDSE